MRYTYEIFGLSDNVRELICICCAFTLGVIVGIFFAAYRIEKIKRQQEINNLLN